MCANCKKHKGTETWVGEGGVMAWTHGAYSMWCECCCLKEQIKYAKKMASQLPKLEKKLIKVNKVNMECSLNSTAKIFDKSTPKVTNMNICNHCKGKIAIRNPKGNCDHLYYPEYCKVCIKKGY